jgi:hypothetical protein
LYLANCLRHLLDNGISFAVIDNGSEDGTTEILRRPDLRRGLVAFEKLPFNGTFALELILQAKEKLALRVDAEWIIHLDADEIMHSRRAGESLHDAIARLAAEGANVINFDEFVFLPIDEDYVPDIAGPQLMRHYYFFEPAPRRLMRAWKSRAGLSMSGTGGHKVTGSDVFLAPESLALRHYIFRSQEHAFHKYVRRLYPEREVHELRWHRNRIKVPVERFRFPPAVAMQRLDSPSSRALSKAHPKTNHYWQWETAPRTSSGLDRGLKTASLDGLPQ